MNKYKYALADFSYFVTRNLHIVSKKGIGNYTAGDCIKVCIQSINKLQRDFGVDASKFIFLADKWDNNFGGYYRTYLLKGLYKDDRIYVTEEMVEQMKNDPNVTEKKLKKAQEECYFNKIKQEAKAIMVRELKNFGIPVLMVPAWEFDDLAYLAAGMLYNSDTRKSVIVTKDSDLMYSVSPRVDLFRTQSKTSPAQFITYDEMCETIPDELKGKISLYGYKAYMDSLGAIGHNNMRRTKKIGANPTQTILGLLGGDYSNVEDIDTFQRQLNSFDISKFPRLEEAQNLIANLFGTVGKLGTLEEFHGFCDRNGISGISDRYYSSFISKFDSKLFCEV